MRTFASWLLGILAFVGFTMAFAALGNVIGVPVQVLFDEPILIETRYYEEERDSSFTSFGLCTVVVSIMIAARIGMAISTGSWRGGLNFRQETQFRAWLVGLSILGCFGAILFLAFRKFHGGLSGIIFNVLEVAAAAGIWWAMKTWHDLRVQRYAAIEKQIAANKEQGG